MISENQSMPTILIADSDDDNRYLLRSLLELKGFHVFLATDGQEAIDTAVSQHPDLVLIQLRLPVVSGFTVIRRLRRCSALQEVPIIAVSLNNPTANRNVAMAAGCDAHIEDPIEFDLLDELIDRLLPGERLPLASILIQ
jgi:two-component system, cell cycle response regulator DivK